VLGRLTTSSAAGLQDPESGLVLPWSPRLAPGMPCSVWYAERQEGVAEEDAVGMLAALCDRKGVVRVRFLQSSAAAAR
jgi:hypothetical protein